MGGFLVDFGSKQKILHNTKKSVMNHTHAHPHYELYVCTENVRQKSVINGTEYVYQYPCAILSTPYTIHAMSCEDPEAVTYEHYVFYFNSAMLNAFDPSLLPSRLLQRNIGLLFPLTLEQADFLQRLLSLCVNARQSMTEVERELLLMLLLNRLFIFCPEDKIIQVGTSSFYLQDVLQYIAEHLHAPIDVASVAEHFSVSRSKLDRDMKRYTGLTVHRVIELCRVNQAKYLLQYKDNSVGEIAALCGFSEETYFFPFFKKHVGITPIEYRNSFQPSFTECCNCFDS